MKKRILLILSCILLSAAILTSVFASTGSGEAVASAPTAAPGETVEVTMYVSEFTQAINTLSAKFTVPEGLELVSGEWLLDGGMKNVNLANKNGVMSTDGDAYDLSQKTAVFKLTFTVKDIEVGQTELENAVSVTIGLNYGSQKIGSVSAETVVTVHNPVTQLEISSQTLELDISGTKTAQLTATYAPLNTTDKLSWKSDNSAVATVDDQGVVTAVAEGETVITVTMGQMTAQCTVKVTCGHTQVRSEAAKDATCVDTGNIAYDVCLTCGDLLEAGTKTETTLDAVTISALDHDFTEKLVDEAHFVAGTGANCQQTKKYYFDCSRCDVMDTTATFDGDVGEHQISDVWTTENEFHFHECTVEGCDHTEGREACDGGKATCIAKATCAACSQPYGQLADCDFSAQKTEEKYLKTAATCKDFAVYYVSCSVCGEKGEEFFTSDILDRENHVGGTEIRDDAEETCTTNGYTGDTYCLGCNEKVQSGETIPATAHATATEVKEIPSTCKTNGVKAHYHCDVCGNDVLEKAADAPFQSAEDLKLALNPENHEGGTEVRDDAEETCTTNGYTGDTYCLGCNAKVEEGEVIPATAHATATEVKEIPSTCKTNGVKAHFHCDVCNKDYLEKKADAVAQTAEDLKLALDPENHEGGTEIRDDAEETCTTNGYTGDTYCLGCNAKVEEGEVIPATAHATATLVEEIPATCKTNGVKVHYHCPVCNKDYLEKTVDAVAQTAEDLKLALNPENHEGGTELRDDAEATCTTNGYTGDTYCLGCNAKVEEGEVIPATAHKDATEVKETPSTCKTNGVKAHFHCDVCNKDYLEKKVDAVAQTADDLKLALNPENHEGGTEVRDDAEATCTTNGYTGDTYCLGCNEKVQSGETISATAHATATEVKEIPSTCKTNGVKAHFHCDVCNKDFLEKTVDAVAQTAEDLKLALNPENHEGGTELRDDAEATCTTNGYTGDTYCLGCNAKVEEGEVIPATAHKDATEVKETPSTCKTNGVKAHFHCDVCNKDYLEKKVDAVAQTAEDLKLALDLENHEGGTEIRDDAEATCTTNGYTGDTYCLGCNTKVETGEVIPATAHKDATEVKETPSTCKTNGVKAHFHCDVCNKDYLEKSVDAVAQSAEDLKLALNPENHAGDTELKNAVAATCSEAGYSGDTYCADCGVELKKGAAIAATGKHTPETTYQTDDQNHWKICSHCDAVLEDTKKAHSLTWIVDKKATESAEGVKHQKCEDCGYLCSENTAIETLEHAPKLVKGKEATATAAGVLEHFYCANCGKYYASENGKSGEQIRRKDTVLPALGNVTGTDWKDEAQIQEVVDAVENAQTGETVTVDMSQQTAQAGTPATFVPVQILEAAREKEATVVLDMGDYSWIIDGKDVKDGELESIDLEVILDTKAIPTETVDALAGDKPTRQLSLIHEGDFGFKAVLKIEVGVEYAGKIGKLYYYNAENELEYITSDEIDAEGYAELEFSHASDYVVVMEEQEPAPTDPEQDGTQATQPGQDTDAPKADMLPVILIVAVIIVIAVVVILVIRKRKQA